MNWFIHDPDEWETVVEWHRCPFHEKNPGVPTPMCTCSGYAGQRRIDPAIAAVRKAERVRKQEDEILAAADAIRARRTSESPPKEP